MRPFQSPTYEYKAAEWKQVARDPQSAAVLRSQYTNFTWNPPGLDKMHFTHNPIWCFVGHRRLYIQPPYPLHPLVNILGADFNEIHDVDMIRLRGEYTKSPCFKKASARIPGREKEPEVLDETYVFFNPT
jgi:hypothetical protein